MNKKMLFGHAEIVAFAENHDDERVRVMLKRYLEARSSMGRLIPCYTSPRHPFWCYRHHWKRQRHTRRFIATTPLVAVRTYRP